MPRSRDPSPRGMILPSAPLRSGWLGGLMPVKALEDTMTSLSLGGAEVGEEVEESKEKTEFWDIPLAFNSPRHLQVISGDEMEMQTWRMKERMKTVSVALVVCLNVGVDPPDVMKTQPCARKECWIDPMSLNPQKAVETIGTNLQRQYERWQPKARYRLSLDPTYDEVKRLTNNLRRSARDERVLFHYNGHGVPKPTTNGEIWVFNRSFTQYIPLSIFELQTWMGTPSIYVYDCNNAGIIVESFKTFAEQHEREYAEQMRNINSQGGNSADIPNPPSLRNFLLSERIMRSCDCTPVSQPPLPYTYQHPMWEAWDLAVDMCLSQLQGILLHDKPYSPSTFFEEQLTAFEVWLAQGSEDRAPPEQLPIVLQVLLSQAHRLRALELLGRFLDLGPWAVNLVLSVGIYPYVLKLLQANARELRPLLVFLWAKILAVDSSCQQDLVRDQSHRYFLAVLQDPAMLTEHKTWSVFVLSSIVQGYKPGQDEALAGNLITLCLNELEESDPVLRQWLAICLGRIWDGHEDARWRGARDNAPERLFNLLSDPVPEVRAAAVYALGTFLNSCGSRTDHANSLDQTIGLRLLQTCLDDGSPLVRRELVVALQWLVYSFLPNLVNLCKTLHDEDEDRVRFSTPTLVGAPTSPRNVLNKSTKTDMTRKPKGSVSSLAPSSSYNELNVTGYSDVSVQGTTRKPKRIMSTQAQSSYTSLATLSMFSGVTSKFKPFFLKLWGGLLLLEKDPDPLVSSLSRTLLDIVWKKMNQKERSADMFRSQGSHLDIHSRSAPSSPGRPTFLLGESPPTSLNTTLPNLLQTSENNSRPGQSWFQRSLFSAIHEEGITSEDGENATLSTQFIEWSAKYFSNQLMRLNSNDDKQSDTYYCKDWMQTRNDLICQRVDQEQRSLLQGTGKLDEQIGGIKIFQPPSVVLMHPYDNEVVVAGRDSVSVYEFSQTQTRSNTFSNKNPKISQITAMEFMNGHVDGLLVTGSDDGAVRVYRDWQKDQQLVSAWNLLPELVPQSAAGDRISVGLCLTWDSCSRVLAAAGDTKYIRLWDCDSEMKLVDLPSSADSFVTSLSMNESARLLAATYYDGSIKLYDPRLHPASSRVMMYREHGKFVLNCRSQENSRLISGCTDGIIKVWDMRRQSSILTINTGQNIIILDIHENAPLFAVWTMSSQLSVHNLNNGKLLNQIRYQDGILGQRFGSVNCLRFHPHLLRLAAGSGDSYLSLYGLRKY